MESFKIEVKTIRFGFDEAAQKHFLEFNAEDIVVTLWIEQLSFDVRFNA